MILQLTNKCPKCDKVENACISKKWYNIPIILSVWCLIILLGARNVGSEQQFSIHSNVRGEQQLNLDSLLEKKYSEADSYFARGLNYHSAGSFREAISNYTKAIEITPTFARTYTKRGEAYLSTEHYFDAISDFNKAIELNPKYAEAYLHRGRAYIRKKQYDNAITDFNSVIEITPGSSVAYNLRGFAYAEGKRQYDNAITDFSQAIKMQPEFARAYNNRGYVYYFKKEYKKAWDDINKAQSLGHTVQPRFLRALREASGRQR